MPVKTLKNSFTRCGHERYAMIIMQNESDSYMKSLIKSYMEGNKSSNEL